MNDQELRDTLRFNLSSKLIETMKCLPQAKKKVLVDQLYGISWTEEQPYAWRAAWVLEHIVTEDKGLIEPYLGEIILRLYDVKLEALRRHYLKILLLFPVDYVDMGRLLDLSFRWLEWAGAGVAVRAHCITAIEKILKYEPEIKEEFVAMLSLLTNDDSKGLKGKAIKVLKKIQ